MVVDCVFDSGLWRRRVSSDNAICTPGILVDQAPIPFTSIRVSHILPITQLCTPQGFIAFEVIIDLIFWGDIFVCFRTSYHEYGKEVFDPRSIAQHYLKYWLSARGKCYGCSASMCFISAWSNANCHWDHVSHSCRMHVCFGHQTLLRDRLVILHSGISSRSCES